jgi:hypothetical protein
MGLQPAGELAAGIAARKGGSNRLAGEEMSSAKRDPRQPKSMKFCNSKEFKSIAEVKPKTKRLASMIKLAKHAKSLEN